MHGLATSAVLVVDDNPGDALPLIQSLSTRGVGALYLSGDPDQFPSKGAVRGVRLAVLDIDLLGVDQSDEEMVKLPVRVLDSVIGPANGPYMVLLWTTNDTLEVLFREEVSELAWPPVATCVLSKGDVRDDANAFDLDEISKRIAASLEDVDPLHLMMLWGQSVHDAASATLEAFGGATGEQWVEEVRDLLGALVRENTPAARLGDHQRCVHGLFDALDQVHTDHLEQAADRVVSSHAFVVEKVATAAAARKTTAADLRARVNRNLLLGPVIEHAAPGTVYVISDLTKSFKADFEHLIADTLQAVAADSTDAKKAAYEAAAAAAVPLAIELTPVCDHQQDSHQLVRLLGGIALPADMEKQLKKAEYLRRIPVIAFDDETLAGAYVVTFNAHFLVTRSRSAIARNRARYRIRHAPLADLFAFNSTHSSRPGFLAIRR